VEKITMSSWKIAEADGIQLKSRNAKRRIDPLIVCFFGDYSG
jgi:hypothetical protein